MMSFFSFFFLKFDKKDRFFFFNFPSTFSRDPDSEPEQSSTIDVVLLSRPMEWLMLLMLAVLCEVTIAGGAEIRCVSEELLDTTALAARALAAEMEPPASWLRDLTIILFRLAVSGEEV